jgi:hypothetical protein
MTELQESIVEMDEMDVANLISSLFSAPPQDPFTIKLEIDEANEQMIIDLLQSVLVQGSFFRFKKAIHALDENEVALMRKYFQSFGWDALYEKETALKPVTDYHENGSAYVRDVSFTYWKFTFQPADPRINKYNSHVMPAHL